jgi:hypothetical protein
MSMLKPVYCPIFLYSDFVDKYFCHPISQTTPDGVVTEGWTWDELMVDYRKVILHYLRQRVSGKDLYHTFGLVKGVSTVQAIMAHARQTPESCASPLRIGMYSMGRPLPRMNADTRVMRNGFQNPKVREYFTGTVQTIIRKIGDNILSKFKEPNVRYSVLFGEGEIVLQPFLPQHPDIGVLLYQNWYDVWIMRKINPLYVGPSEWLKHDTEEVPK